MAVRLWARTSEKVEPIVRQADAQRLDALAKMFERYGVDKGLAIVRARVLYFTQIGQFTLYELEDPAERFSHVGNYLRIFTGKEPTQKQTDRFVRFAEKTLDFKSMYSVPAPGE